MKGAAAGRDAQQHQAGSVLKSALSVQGDCRRPLAGRCNTSCQAGRVQYSAVQHSAVQRVRGSIQPSPTMLIMMMFKRLSTVKSGCQLPAVPLSVSA